MSNKSFYEQIGARIQGLRHYYSVSLEALARWMDVPPYYLHRLELGNEYSLVNRYAVISKAFDIPLDYLFTGKLVRLVNHQSLAATASYISSPAYNSINSRFMDLPPILKHNEKAHYTLQCYDILAVGNRIHKLRLLYGFSLEELANQLGVIPLHLDIIEYGKIIGAGSKEILMLSKIFDVATDYLVFGEDDMRINRLALGEELAAWLRGVS